MGDGERIQGDIRRYRQKEGVTLTERERRNTSGRIIKLIMSEEDKRMKKKKEGKRKREKRS
jgi:hypothetical protein